MARRLLVTGSSGLIGSESVTYFEARGWTVHGIDNNLRREFLGPDGDTSWNLQRLKSVTQRFTHHELDIRDRPRLMDLVASIRPDFVIHCAAQPSHDLAVTRPFDDFEVNAVGTLNVLEAVRRSTPEAVFCHLSTNKVYGDAPNRIRLKELPTRWDYDDPRYTNGISEDVGVDQVTHTLYGASKLAADVMVQEYGRYLGMNTGCFRGGCLTGPGHSGAEMHGYLAYLIKACAEGRTYRINGYKGKQVRDNIHAFDVCRALEAFQANPRPGEVYNLGGGRGNSVSLLEAIARAESVTGRTMKTVYVDEPRHADHLCYISDLTKLKRHFPGWDITKSLDDIFREIAQRSSSH